MACRDVHGGRAINVECHPSFLSWVLAEVYQFLMAGFLALCFYFNSNGDQVERGSERVAGRQSVCGSTDQSDNSWPWSSDVIHNISHCPPAARHSSPGGFGMKSLRPARPLGAEAKGSVVMPLNIPLFDETSCWATGHEPSYFGPHKSILSRHVVGSRPRLPLRAL